MSNLFNIPVEELIKIRHSVRNYDYSPLSEEIINKIESYISKVKNPFNPKIRIKLIKKDNSNKELNKIDVGIALCHFHLSAMDKNISVEFTSLNFIKNQDIKFTYVIYWINNK